jgi:hypothetical protein
MLEYTRIFPCRAGVEIYRARRAGAQTTLLVTMETCFRFCQKQT